MLYIDVGTSIAAIRVLGKPRGEPLLKPTRKSHKFTAIERAAIEEFSATLCLSRHEAEQQYRARMDY
jgi:hypothetical protein